MMLSISFSCQQRRQHVVFYPGGRRIKLKFAVILRDGYARAAMADIINRLLENGLAESLGLNSACEKTA